MTQSPAEPTKVNLQLSPISRINVAASTDQTVQQTGQFQYFSPLQVLLSNASNIQALQPSVTTGPVLDQSCFLKIIQDQLEQLRISLMADFRKIMRDVIKEEIARIPQVSVSQMEFLRRAMTKYTPVFNGTVSDAHCFLPELEVYVYSLGYGYEEALKTVVPSTFQGPALIWFKNYSNQFLDWIDFRRMFKATYFEPDSSIQQRYYSYFQQPSEPFCDFVFRICDEGLKLSNPSVFEDDMLSVMYNNAAEWAQQLVDQWQPKPQSIVEFLGRLRDEAEIFVKEEQERGIFGSSKPANCEVEVNACEVTNQILPPKKRKTRD